MSSPLRTLDPAPAVKVGALRLEVTEAGRTATGLTATVMARNGRLQAGRRVCLADAEDRAALDAELAAATGQEKGAFLQPLLDLVDLVEEDMRPERRSTAVVPSDRTRPLTEMGNAERLVDRHGRQIRYCSRWREWLAYDGTRWRRGADATVLTRAKDTVRKICQEAAEEERAERRTQLTEWARRSESRKSVEAMMRLAQSDVQVEPAEFDVDPWLLNCANGTLDLRTGVLREHRPEDLLTKSTGVAYDPQAPCPRFEQFMLQIMGDDEEMVRFLRRALGYSITGVVREHCLFLPWGGGRNGKSMLLGTIQAALGDHALQAVSDLLLAKRFESHPTERADLFGKRFVATIEVDEGRRLVESLTKQLTGGDDIRARGMRENFYQFKPTHKIWLAANHKPVVRGGDDAIWDRIYLIPFTVRFALPDQDRAEGGAATDGDRTTKPADPDLGDKLRAELPGILAWLVRGCLEWRAHGLQVPAAVKAATRAYREEMDLLRPFLQEKCLLGPNLSVKASVLYAAHRAHCEQAGDKPLSQRELAPLLRRHGLRRDDKRTNQGYFWHGLALREEREPGGGVNHGEPSAGTIAQKQSPKGANSQTVHQGSQGSPSAKAAGAPGGAQRDNGAPGRTGPAEVNHVNDGEPSAGSRAIGGDFQACGTKKVHHGSPAEPRERPVPCPVCGGTAMYRLMDMVFCTACWPDPKVAAAHVRRKRAEGHGPQEPAREEDERPHPIEAGEHLKRQRGEAQQDQPWEEEL